MSNEGQMTSSFSIRQLDSNNDVTLEYRATPTSYQFDVTGTFGPTPGTLAVTTSGVEVDLSKLTTPGFCRIYNHDDTNYVEYGILDSNGATFHELGEVGPKEHFDLKLSRNIGSGSGTAYESLFIKANSATCNVSVLAFER